MFGDPLDPFQQADQFNLRRQQKETAKEMFTPYVDPEEEESALSRLFGAGLTGLGYVGESIGKLGRTVRTGLGLASGDERAKASNLLSFVPFSDAMGLTAPEDTPTGQQLLETWGMRDPNRPKPEGFFENVVDMLPGLGVDIATDPLSYATFGSHALTSAGRAAKAANTLDKTSLVNRIRQGHQSLVGFGVPGQGLLGYHNATPFAGPATASALDTAGYAFGRANQAAKNIPVVGKAIGATEYGLGKAYDWTRGHLNAMFDDTARNVSDIRVQDPLRALHAEREAAKIQALSKVDETYIQARDAGLLTGDKANDAAVAARIRKQVELGGLPDPRPGGSLAAGLHGPTLPLYADPDSLVRDIADVWKGLDANSIAEYQASGGGVDKLHDPLVNFAHRSLNPIPGTNLMMGSGTKGADVPTRAGTLMRREDIFRGYPTDFLQDASLHPKISGVQELLKRPMKGSDFKDAIKYFRDEMGARLGITKKTAKAAKLEFEQLAPDMQALLAKSLTKEPSAAELAQLATSPLSLEEYSKMKLYQKSGKTARALAQQPRGRILFDKPLYDQDAFEMVREGLRQTIDATYNQNALVDSYLKFAKPRLGGAAHDAVPLASALRKHGMKLNAAERPEFVQALMQRTGKTLDELMDTYVPRDLANVALAKGGRGMTPEILRGPMKVLDSITNLFKTGNASMAPFNLATAVRNFTGGGIKDTAEIGFGRWREGVNIGRDILAGKVTPGISGYTPELLSEMAGTGLAKTGQRAGLSSPLSQGVMASLPQLSPADLAELARLKDREAMRTVQTFMSAGGFPAQYARNEIVGVKALEAAGKIPGVEPRTLMGDMKEAIGPMFRSQKGKTWWDSPWNPFATRGVFGAEETHFGPALVGGAWNERGDALNRIAQAIGMADQGVNLKDPIQAAVAARRVQSLHGANLTDFERDAMSRLVPFYRWQWATNVPYEIGQLAQNPGGYQGQLLRAAGALRQQQGFLPGYLQGGVAAPVGGQTAGLDDKGLPTTTQRYLTQTDVPVEAAVGWIDPRGLAQTAMRLLGQTNPIIKAPLELATNRQFYSGREMEDLYSRTGSPVLDQLLYNSPLAKATTTIGTLRDTRKDALALALNLGTGLKLSDVDLTGRRNHAITEAVRDATKGNRSFTNFESIAPRLDMLDQFSPDDTALYRLYLTTKARQRERAKMLGQ